MEKEKEKKNLKACRTFFVAFSVLKKIINDDSFFYDETFFSPKYDNFFPYNTTPNGKKNKVLKNPKIKRKQPAATTAIALKKIVVLIIYYTSSHFVVQA